MSTPTPIITKPPTKEKQAAKVSLLPQGVQKISTVCKQYSTWALAVLVAAPELYQAAASLGMLADESMPESVKWAIRGVAGVGLIAKFIKQQKPTE